MSDLNIEFELPDEICSALFNALINVISVHVKGDDEVILKVANPSSANELAVRTFKTIATILEQYLTCLDKYDCKDDNDREEVQMQQNLYNDHLSCLIDHSQLSLSVNLDDSIPNEEASIPNEETKKESKSNLISGIVNAILPKPKRLGKSNNKGKTKSKAKKETKNKTKDKSKPKSKKKNK